MNPIAYYFNGIQQVVDHNRLMILSVCRILPDTGNVTDYSELMM